MTFWVVIIVVWLVASVPLALVFCRAAALGDHVEREQAVREAADRALPAEQAARDDRAARRSKGWEAA